MEMYSVLMTVYNKENPDFFTAAIQSMLSQTVKTDDFVIVCDGPLTSELEAVLETCVQKNPGLFNIVRLQKNVGIGRATNVGLQHCCHDLVAKMDSDDIALPERCEKQLNMYSQNSELMVLGGYIEEFDRDPETPFAIRCVPESNEEIRAFAKRRQPFNNQTVMYRRSAVNQVGGYRTLRRSEDYDLYLRMLHHGCQGANLMEVLTKVRVNREARMRRSSWDTLKGCVKSRWYAYSIGYSSLLDFLVCVIGELIITVSPGIMQKFIYKCFLRKGCEG